MPTPLNQAISKFPAGGIKSFADLVTLFDDLLNSYKYSKKKRKPIFRKYAPYGHVFYYIARLYSKAPDSESWRANFKGKSPWINMMFFPPLQHARRQLLPLILAEVIESGVIEEGAKKVRKKYKKMILSLSYRALAYVIESYLTTYGISVPTGDVARFLGIELESKVMKVVENVLRRSGMISLVKGKGGIRMTISATLMTTINAVLIKYDLVTYRDIDKWKNFVEVETADLLMKLNRMGTEKMLEENGYEVSWEKAKNVLKWEEILPYLSKNRDLMERLVKVTYRNLKWFNRRRKEFAKIQRRLTTFEGFVKPGMFKVLKAVVEKGSDKDKVRVPALSMIKASKASDVPREVVESVVRVLRSGFVVIRRDFEDKKWLVKAILRSKVETLMETLKALTGRVIGAIEEQVERALKMAELVPPKMCVGPP